MCVETISISMVIFNHGQCVHWYVSMAVKQSQIQLFRTTNIYYVSFHGSGVQEQLGRVMQLLISAKAKVRLLRYQLEPSSQGWIGRGTASKVTQVVVGKSQLLAGHWNKGLCSSLSAVWSPSSVPWYAGLTVGQLTMATRLHQKEQVRASRKQQPSETQSRK